MNIIILGAGSVGSTLAESLSRENHNITMIDKDRSKLRDIQNRFDIGTVVGHASYPNVLRNAGADSADMIIAVTDSDEVNMVACQVAYSLFSTPTKIARVRAPHYFIRKELFGDENLPVDVFISPEAAVTYYVKELIEHPGALQVLDFAEGKVKLVAVKPFYGGPLVGKKLSQIKEVLPDTPARVAAIFREDRSIPLDGSTEIEIGDEVFFIAATEHIRHIMGALRRLDKPYKRIVIAGGGNIGSGLAKILENDYQVKIIDLGRERCNNLAEILHNTTVLCGDTTDEELLVSENIEDCDLFCAMTNDEEVNIMSCMLAKRLGANQVMALINRPAYVDLIEGSGINIAISPQQSTISSILAHIRRGDVVNVHSLRRGAAEAIEAVAHGDEKTSKVVGKNLKNIKLPKGTTIGAIVRGEEVIIPRAITEVKSEDHVILFLADKKHIRQVEKMFQVGVTFI